MNWVLSCNTLDSPSELIESLTGYSGLGWHVCSLTVCITPLLVIKKRKEKGKGNDEKGMKASCLLSCFLLNFTI